MKKAAEEFAWQCAERYINDAKRLALAGANTFHHPDDGPDERRQALCDGFILATYDVPFDGLVQAPKPRDGKVPPVEKYLRASRGAMRDLGFKTGQLPNFKEVKRLWAEEKRRCSGHPQDRNYRYCLAMENTRYLSVFVDVRKLIQFMELTDSKGGETFFYTEPLNPIFLEVWREYSKPRLGLAIEGALLPMRVAEGSPVLNLPKEG